MSTPAAPDRFEKVRDAMLAFRDAREWKQFHDPKNLAEGLAIEAGELLEAFLWKTTDECRRVQDDPKAIAKIREELADCFLFCVLMADACDIDLISAAHDKIERNAQKYPVDRAKGRRDKYDAL